MYSFHIDEFEGPLDLLLHLIEHRELDITRVSLAAVCDQFLEVISTPGTIDLSQLADYLIIAAKLVLIKSRLLLPQPEAAEEGEEDVGDALAQQLREYKMFKQVAMFLRERERQGLHAYPRFAPPPRPEPTNWRIVGINADDLAMALQRALKIRPTLPQGTLTVPLQVSIDQKIESIVRLTRERENVNFTQLLEQSETRVEIIVTFLAVLELIKRRLVYANQDRLFGEILLTRRDDEPLPQVEPNLDDDYTTETTE